MNVKTSHYKIVLFGVKTDTYDLYCKFKNDIDLIITLDNNEINNYKISGGKNINSLAKLITSSKLFASINDIISCSLANVISNLLLTNSEKLDLCLSTQN